MARATLLSACVVTYHHRTDTGHVAVHRSTLGLVAVVVARGDRVGSAKDIVLHPHLGFSVAAVAHPHRGFSVAIEEAQPYRECLVVAAVARHAQRAVSCHRHTDTGHAAAHRSVQGLAAAAVARFGQSG